VFEGALAAVGEGDIDHGLEILKAIKKDARRPSRDTRRAGGVSGGGG
jgi:hypothetical protein